jgi:hypothetical protein
MLLHRFGSYWDKLESWMCPDEAENLPGEAELPARAKALAYPNTDEVIWYLSSTGTIRLCSNDLI